MVRTKENSASVPVSKYAMKKRKLAEETFKESFNESDDTVETDATDDADASAENANTRQTYKRFNKSYKRPFNKEGNPNYVEQPEHVRNLTAIIANNAEIRRFTSLGIINYLLQKREITGDKNYVMFKRNKFTVTSSGLSRDYLYTEPFFLNCLIASFSSFGAHAQKIINTFTKIEMSVGIDKAVDDEDVKNIVSLVDNYQTSKESTKE